MQRTANRTNGLLTMYKTISMIDNKGISNDNGQCPLLLKPWVYLYESTPTGNLPFTKTSITFSFLSFTFLLVCKLLIRQFVISMDWPDDDDTNEVCNLMTSIVHSLILCPPLLVLLVTQPFVPSASMDKAPDWWQSSAHGLLEFCTGYMVYDGLYNFVYLKYIKGGIPLSTEDWCFLGHHLATSCYMTFTRINGAGHLSAMVIMFWGEISNPAQNLRSICIRTLEMGDCCSTKFVQDTFYPIINVIYALMYSIIRVGLNPYLNLRITYDFLFTSEGRERIPIAASLILLFMLWGITLGSIPWCLEAVDIVKIFVEGGGGGTESQEL